MEVGVLRRHGPARMWTMLLVCLLLLVPLGVLSNVTHSLLLTLEVYHMLYNALSLAGWLLAVRLDAAAGSPTRTFGWARLEVLTTVMTLLFLAALCFSISVEAVQSIADAAHSDNMHHPVYVMACAAAVLLANLICYMLVGGFTSLQSTLLAPSEAAKHLSPAASEAQLQPDARLARRTPAAPLVRHYVRDLTGAMLLVVSSVTAYLRPAPLVRYLDPSLALLAVAVLVLSSRSLFSECCLILLQTMPATFEPAAFRARLLTAFPVVQDVHELHVWQLTPDCVVATAHVVLAGPQQFNDVAERVTAFFAAHAVGRVTLQPEFSGTTACSAGSKSRCLLPCAVDSCASSRCCDQTVLRRVPTIRVTPPSQASLVSSRGSGSVRTTPSVAPRQTSRAAPGVNGDCGRHSPEPNTDSPADSPPAGDEPGQDAPGVPVPAPRSPKRGATSPSKSAAEEPSSTKGAAEEPSPTKNAAEEPTPAVRATTESAPSNDVSARSDPSESAAMESIPLNDGKEPDESSRVAGEVASPPESTKQTLLSTGAAAEPYGSVSSVGDWQDAEG